MRGKLINRKKGLKVNPHTHTHTATHTHTLKTLLGLTKAKLGLKNFECGSSSEGLRVS